MFEEKSDKLISKDEVAKAPRKIKISWILHDREWILHDKVHSVFI